MRQDYIIPDMTSGNILASLICIYDGALPPIVKSAMKIDTGVYTNGMILDLQTKTLAFPPPPPPQAEPDPVPDLIEIEEKIPDEKERIILVDHGPSPHTPYMILAMIVSLLSLLLSSISLFLIFFKTLNI